MSACHEKVFHLNVLSLLVIPLLLGYRLSPRREESESSAPGHRILYYRDPMHPAYKSDKPGTASASGARVDAAIVVEQTHQKLKVWEPEGQKKNYDSITEPRGRNRQPARQVLSCVAFSSPRRVRPRDQGP